MQQKDKAPCLIKSPASVLYIEVLKLRCLVITIPHGVVVSIVDSGAAGPGSNPGGGIVFLLYRHQNKSTTV